MPEDKGDAHEVGRRELIGTARGERRRWEG